jgi:hypothetical protein
MPGREGAKYALEACGEQDHDSIFYSRFFEFRLRLATLCLPQCSGQYITIGGTDMPLQNHLTELERKHRALEREIQDTLNRPSADDMRLAELKRRKLQLKDEIARLRSSESAVH